jgi:hypothetical protein
MNASCSQKTQHVESYLNRQTTNRIGCQRLFAPHSCWSCCSMSWTASAEETAFLLQCGTAAPQGLLDPLAFRGTEMKSEWRIKIRKLIRGESRSIILARLWAAAMLSTTTVRTYVHHVTFFVGKSFLFRRQQAEFKTEEDLL